MQHRAYRDLTISIGSISASIVHPREVYKPAIDHLASAIILMHNHPSGELKPSRQDIEITRMIHKAGEILAYSASGSYYYRAPGICEFTGTGVYGVKNGNTELLRKKPDRVSTS
ncbi:MAG: JAB domain-containing protein [Candidatus Marinimicrobia bacterium]|nr:JAB domain-containing protein [Candidatus Neomarinimicrobiota bacterium]